ncbi:MAG: DUF4316 domain-containing protein [Clostridia bacterium]|nr:DUF4316 domain-containing protein [Clostridia bacterium]
MKPNQYAIYQLKTEAQFRELRFRPYQYILDQTLEVRVENYEQVYLAAALADDDANSIWKRFREHPPKSFKGHSISVSDVLVYNKAGVTTSYYIDKERLVVIAGFIRWNTSGTLITMDTRDYQLEGKAGNWIATDEIIVDGKQFFLLQNERYQEQAAYLVVDEYGKLVADDSFNGFDDSTIGKIRDYMKPPEKPVIQQASESSKQQMENWQKYFENGEYLRSAEMSEEQNYNMIDGRINNKPPKSKKKQRTSVLAKLHQKQKEIAVRSGKQPPSMEADMERNRK